MGCRLPDLDAAAFADALRRVAPLPLSGAAEAILFAHFQTLRRWNPRLSLIGPGTAQQVLGRHYGEALAALPLLGAEDRTVVDIGSGAGFPGFVLAAARPGMAVFLVESRARKWSFLKAAVRAGNAAAAAVRPAPPAALSCTCVNARIGRSLPPGLPQRIDIVTSRAVDLQPSLLALFVAHSPGVRFLLWQGASPPPLPPGLTARRRLELAGSERRRIVEAGRPRR